ncbi:cobyric acid synthase [Leptospirillum ferriphilum]|uniref:cobyric acid synthase n=1 Tax=Leptospirillum ferriphilum TaxID=178606 RepID=UPI002118D714|nr:cobyric acid synthase [Leptospirillum ferriphilum]
MRNPSGPRRLMVLGTGSGVGKSLVVAGLCRYAKNRGLSVAPFKAQNMSNNAAVTRDGGEIGRAQYLQAQAAGTEPDVRMNPILLKPLGEGKSQVIFLGRPLGVYDIRGYRDLKVRLAPQVVEVFHEYVRSFDLVVLEGAGSPAEINLLEEDLVNTRMARWAGAEALLLGDIEQGGVFASLFGTWSLLPPEDRRVIRWMGINKFRGDRSLLDGGFRALEKLTGVPVLGVLEHLGDLPLPDEDSYRVRRKKNGGEEPLRLAVIAWPHLSNRSDFDPFLGDPGVRLDFLSLDETPVGPIDCVFLPGTRQTVGDLEAFRRSPLYGWFERYRKEKGRVVGICGGYQMMAGDILDPANVESSRSWVNGLGILPFSVRFEKEKLARRVHGQVREGTLPFFSGSPSRLEGYEIRHGRTLPHGGGGILDLYAHDSGGFLGTEGQSSEDGRSWGVPVHGLFENEAFRRRFLEEMGPLKESSSLSYSDRLEGALDELGEKVHAAFPLLNMP